MLQYCRDTERGAPVKTSRFGRQDHQKPEPVRVVSGFCFDIKKFSGGKAHDMGRLGLLYRVRGGFDCMYHYRDCEPCKKK